MVPPLTFQLPRLYPKQMDAIFTSKRYSIIEASTKSGKTVGCIVWILDRALQTGKEGRNYWWIAPVFAQTYIAYRRLKRWLNQADPDQITWQANESKLEIELVNGALIVFKSGDKPDSLYGEDVFAAVVDEGTRVKEDAWYAVRSTLTATRGPIRIIGNVKGRRNWVWRLARRAEAGEPDHHYARLTALDAIEGGIFDKAEMEDARRNLPEHVFRELYMAEAADDEGNPFGLQAIRRCIIPELGDGPVICWGGDLAVHVDWTVMTGLNADGDVCAFQRWRSDWRDTTARIRAMVGNTPALIDATGVGRPIVEELQLSCPAVEGELYTSKSKHGLMVGLAEDIHKQDVGYPEGIIVSELECFEYIVQVSSDGRVTGVTYGAPAGMTDDCVNSLALACRCRRVMPVMQMGVLGQERYVPSLDIGYDPMEDERLWT